MPKKGIALLGWGSLLWDGGDGFDSQHEPWRYDGPLLKIEFSRVSSSRGGALTLVIDAENGAPTPVAWCLSRKQVIGEAIEDLRHREGTAPRHIGYWSRAGEIHHRDAVTVAAIRAWAAAQGLDAVVWTDLPSNFREIVGRPFSVPAAIAYLRSLTGDRRRKALEYIRRAPSVVRTPLRDTLEQMALDRAL